MCIALSEDIFAQKYLICARDAWEILNKIGRKNTLQKLLRSLVLFLVTVKAWAGRDIEVCKCASAFHLEVAEV